jgi:SAM-dependent methyltransferase
MGLKSTLRQVVPTAPCLFYMGRQRRMVRDFIASASGDRVLNIGSGRTTYGTHVVNLDMRPTPQTTVIGDARMLPFRNGAFRHVLCESALEHVKGPEQAVAEMHRALAPSGRFLAIVSFMTPFHAERDSREDYQRYTAEGLRHLFRDFADLRIGPVVGPASAYCLHAQFFAASFWSFGSMKLFYFWMYILAWPLWPIKWLDAWLLTRSNADTAATDLWCAGVKPKTQA